MGHYWVLLSFVTVEVTVHPFLHIGHLTTIVTNNGWHTTGNCSGQLGCGEERGHPDSLNRLRELHFITAATMGFDRTEMTLPDENAADTVCN